MTTETIETRCKGCGYLLLEGQELDEEGICPECATDPGLDACYRGLAEILAKGGRGPAEGRETYLVSLTDTPAATPPARCWNCKEAEGVWDPADEEAVRGLCAECAEVLTAELDAEDVRDGVVRDERGKVVRDD